MVENDKKVLAFQVKFKNFYISKIVFLLLPIKRYQLFSQDFQSWTRSKHIGCDAIKF